MQQQFRHCGVCCARVCVAPVCYEVSADRNANPIGIGLLWPIIINDTCVSPFVAHFHCNIDFLMCHNEHWIRAFLASLVVTLRHSAKIFTKRHLSDFSSFGIMHQSFVIGDRFARCRMDHGWCKMCVVWDMIYDLRTICVRNVWVWMPLVG